MKRALLLALLVAACGDDGQKMPDGGMQPTGDAMDDAEQPATLTSYVIDLIANGTSDTTQARPYSEFSSLADPDTANPSAYSSLF